MNSAPALVTERLGLHHFAYLRALAEGLAVPEAAARYLHIDHARAARHAHRLVIERARALARRRGDPAWRLVGIEIRMPGAHAAPAQAGAEAELPSLDEWAAAQGFDGLRESELLELYTEAFGLAGSGPAAAEDNSLRRRRQRAERLRQRQLQALRALEAAAAQPARAEDPVDGWLSPVLVQQLVPAGVCTLADLQRRIARGGRWWRGVLHAYGPTKAARLAQHLVLLMGTPGPAGGQVDAHPQYPASAVVRGPGVAPALLPVPLLPGTPAPTGPRDPMALASVARLLFGPVAPGQDQTPAGATPVLPAWALGGSVQPSREADATLRGAVARLAATDDRAAVREWIATRAGSAPTAVRYEREAERWMLWIITERGRALSAATALDCRLYMDHLASLPEAWISRRKVARWAPGWAPFRGPLSPASQAYAVHVLHGLYEWLVQAGYLLGNPWVLVNRRQRETVQPLRAAHGPTSRAFTPAAWAALRAHLDASPPGPSVERLRWLCTFGEATGLRAAELLRAEVGHLQSTSAGWVLAVVGKGGRARVVPVPHVAMQATRQYLASRGTALTTAPPGTPLLAALDAPRAPTYGALYETFIRFVRRALAGSALSSAERDRAASAAVHWLRHTHATRAAERGVPPDVLQEGLGHSDPRQTAHYYRAQMERRQRAMEGAFGTSSVPGQ